MASDETLCCEFWETDSNEVIIAVKSYVIPNPDDMDVIFKYFDIYYNYY